MNKRKKVVSELKDMKVLCELSKLITKNNIDRFQKKSLVCELEMYKQQNNDFFEKNKELRSENEVFYGIINFLLKKDDAEFVASFFSDDKDVFYRRLIDYISRTKNYGNKKCTNQHKNSTSTSESEESSFVMKNADTFTEIINEVEKSFFLRNKEQIEEKENQIYHLKKRIIELESIASTNKNSGMLSNDKEVQAEHKVDFDELVKCIEASNETRMAELADELKNAKQKLIENDKMRDTIETYEARIKNLEKALKQMEDANYNFLRDMHKSAETFKEKIKAVTTESEDTIRDLRQKVKNEKQMNDVLKDEIRDLEAEIKALKTVNAGIDRKEDEILRLQKELNVHMSLKNMIELEKRDSQREQEKFAREMEAFEHTKNKLYNEIAGLKGDIHDRSSAALFHKNNYLKANSDLQYLTLKIQKLEKSDSMLREDLKRAQDNQVQSSLKIRMLNDDIRNYKTVVKMLTGTSSPEIIENLDKYRKLLRCSVCDENYKDTAIIRCMHVLCRGCVENRLRMRNRKCPICGESFSAADVKQVFL